MNLVAFWPQYRVLTPENDLHSTCMTHFNHLLPAAAVEKVGTLFGKGGGLAVLGVDEQTALPYVPNRWGQNDLHMTRMENQLEAL